MAQSPVFPDGLWAFLFDAVQQVRQSKVNICRMMFRRGLSSEYPRSFQPLFLITI